MNGSCEHLKNMDERALIANRILELSPLIPLLEDSYASVMDSEGHSPLNPAQRKRKRSEFVNMRTRNQWEEQQLDNPWRIVDSCYTHMMDDLTQLGLEMHPADYRTGGLPAPAHTHAAHARYIQSECLPADQIQWNIGNDGELGPDLSRVHLQAIWRWDNGRMYVTIYKPVDAKRRKACLEIPLLGSREDQGKIKYEAVPENEILLPDLIDDEHTRSERKKMNDKIDTTGDVASS